MTDPSENDASRAPGAGLQNRGQTALSASDPLGSRGLSEASAQIPATDAAEVSGSGDAAASTPATGAAEAFSPPALTPTLSMRATSAAPTTNDPDFEKIFEALRTDTTAERQVDCLEDLTALLRKRTRRARAGAQGFDAELNRFLDWISERPTYEAIFLQAVEIIEKNADVLPVFCESGFPSRASILGEFVERVQIGILPEPPDAGNLGRILHRLFPTNRAIEMVEQCSANTLQRFVQLLAKTSFFDAIQHGMIESGVVLATRIAASGMSPEFRARLDAGTIEESPFVALLAVFSRTARRLLRGEDCGMLATECRQKIADCRQAIRKLLATLDRTGISVDLVYRIDTTSREIDRLYLLLAVVAPTSGSSNHRVARLLFQAAVRGEIQDRSVTELLANNSRLLARRIIERAGEGGEHYITSTRREQLDMVSSAAGGGALTALMVISKSFVSHAKLPPLFEGFGLGLNYGFGFIFMQLAHFTLATKQPAMTAAALAAAIEEKTLDRAANLEPLVELVARTVRSQIAAIIGNIGMAIPIALLVDALLQWQTGHSMYDSHYAEKTIANLHPFASGTIFYAFCTGVFLWISSVAAGTIENWFVVRRLAEAIAANRILRSTLGRARAAKFADWLGKNISGFGGNLSFGLILGFFPFIGQILGIPLDVRHVTFSSAALAYSGMTVGTEGVLNAAFAWAVLGVLITGALNFSVSFALAIRVAFRARDITLSEEFGLVRGIFRAFRQSPSQFFIAPPAKLTAESEQS